jgi:predicted MPP superfamily phosphohydrolase
LQPEAIGPYEVSVFDALVAEQPDLVLFLGDTMWGQWGGRMREPLRAQLRRLSPRLGMFAVVGDVEGDLQSAEAVFAGTGVRVLEDATAALPGVPIDVIGLSCPRSRRPAIDLALAQQLRGDRFPIVIGHAPDYMRSVLDRGLRADALLLAGHTHGGQVQVPFVGPLVTLSSVPGWLAAGGVFRRGDAWLAVTRGLGMEGLLAPRIRFWCRPQILVLDLMAPPG